MGPTPAHSGTRTYKGKSQEQFLSRTTLVHCSRAHICHRLYPWRKNCHVEKFGLSIKKFEQFMEFYQSLCRFVPNLCGEKSAWRESLCRKMTNMRSGCLYLIIQGKLKNLYSIFSRPFVCSIFCKSAVVGRSIGGY